MNTRLSSIIVAVALAWAWTGSSAKAAETYSGLLRGSEVRGAKVKNLQNEEIGDIQEIVIEPVAGLLRFAVVSVPSPGCDAAGPSGGGRKQHVGWRGLLDSRPRQAWAIASGWITKRLCPHRRFWGWLDACLESEIAE
jgi:hypothetical protein